VKILKIIIIIGIFLTFGCSSPKPFEIKDICAQPEGTEAILQGYLSLPKTIDTIQLTKGGKIIDVGYQIFLTTKADATGDAAKVTIWTTNKGEPNKIKAFSNGYSRGDLIVYSVKGEEVRAGKIIKITGEIVPNEKTDCAVSVTKIELP
jgi:hypothetical protein